MCKCLRSPGIDSEKSIPPAYEAWRAGTPNRVVVPALGWESVPGLLKRFTNTGSVQILAALLQRSDVFLFRSLEQCTRTVHTDVYAGDCFCDRSVRSIRELASGQFTQVRLEPKPHTSVALTARYLNVN